MTHLPAARLSLCTLASLSACSSDPRILVDLRTDLVAGIELREIDVSVVRGMGLADLTVSRVAAVGDDFVAGRWRRGPGGSGGST